MKNKSFSQWLDSKRVGEIPDDVQTHKITGEEIGQVARSPYLLYGLPAIAGAAFFFGAPAVLASIPVITGVAILDASRGERGGWLLSPPDRPNDELSDDLFEDGEWWGQNLQDALDANGIPAEVISKDNSSARMDVYGLKVKKGFDISKLSGYGGNFARDLGLPKGTVFSVEPNIGDGLSGLFLPKKKRDCKTVYLAGMLSDAVKSGLALPAVVGIDASGKSLIFDLVKAKHTLVAGETGGGKSVEILNMIMSMAYCVPPEKLRLSLIDPKKIELSFCDGMPHLGGNRETITDMGKAVKRLFAAVSQMNARYSAMKAEKARSIEQLSKKIPYHVIVLEELTELVTLTDEIIIKGVSYKIGKIAEYLISKLVRLGRAAGIILIIGAQRFDAEVFSGQIRSNIPSAIGMRVKKRVFSDMIIEQSGCENLLGQGDCYVLLTGQQSPTRAQAAYASDEDIESIVQAIIKKWKS